MFSSRRRLVMLFAVCLLCLPVAAPGQGTPSFDNLQGRLSVGQKAIVTDLGGNTVTGRVTELSAGAVTLSTGTGNVRFTPSDVAILKRPGPIWDGAVKGAAIGGIAGLLIGRGFNFSGQLAGIGMMMGAPIGLGIDALFGPRTLFRATSAPQRIAVTPVVSKHRRAIHASISF